jgi:hypothetical protein
MIDSCLYIYSFLTRLERLCFLGDFRPINAPGGLHFEIESISTWQYGHVVCRVMFLPIQ